MNLADPATNISGIGSIVAKRLERLGIRSVFDLLYHLPFRYKDRSRVAPIVSLQPGETVAVEGVLTAIKNEYTRRGKVLQTGRMQDASGQIEVIWFNQPFLTKNLKAGQKVALWGKVDFFNHKKTLVSPDYELLTNSYQLHTGRLVPVYPETAGITSKWLRSKIHSLLGMHGVQSLLSGLDRIDREWTPGLKPALEQIHFPNSLDQVEPVRQKLARFELLLLQLAGMSRKQAWQKTRLTHPFAVDQEKVLQFISNLPFSLTASQNQAIKEILTDLSQPRPMNRLLEGDVGSGKTVVAAVAAYVAHLNGCQSLIMAPTQILAAQHFQTLSTLFRPMGIEVGLVTAGKKLNPKPSTLNPIIVGTHALLSRQLPDVGLVVIDEQHRFGVAQRSLAASKGQSPHILTMTATPIPRTMALTMYGDLDLSVLADMPVGRSPIKTWVVPESKREAAQEWIRSQLTTQNSQLFWVCPFIEESETLTTVKAATAEYLKLQAVFAPLQLGLLHGKLKGKEKDEVMKKFRAGECPILVTTPVVEVGIDVPNAAIMVVDGADRFGLAQLHQLRGRVGRGGQQAYCLLFADRATARLKAMEKHQSGIELAEIDLKLRGPGEVYGLAQHGQPHFKAAGYSDLDLIEKAKRQAETLLPQLDRLPTLKSLLEKDKIGLVTPN